MVFYRKYRPQFFYQILGQEFIKETLQNALGSKKISHAYLFSGPHGTGKTTIARLLAKGLNCLNFQKGESCNQCENCLEINQGKAIDLLEIDGASNRGINEIKNLKENIKTTPFKLRFKVFIIDEVHMLTPEAFNALLKMIEEPPKHVVFIFATTSAEKIPLTILSRCQRFNLKKVDSLLIAKKISEIAQKENIEIEQKAIDLIVQKANGSIRDAESALHTFFSGNYKKITFDLVSSFLGKTYQEKILKITELISEKNIKEVLEMVEDLADEGTDFNDFLKEFLEFLRKLLLFKIEKKSVKDFSKEEEKKISCLSDKFKEDEIISLIELFLKEQKLSRESPLPQFPLELAIIKSFLAS